MHETLSRLIESDFPEIRRFVVKTLQVNLGYRCNQSCLHCHVAAGPNRTEMMNRETVDTVIDCLRSGAFETLDITGGAPELNPHFRDLVRAARQLGVHVMDRCNLSILSESGQEDLAAFLAEHGVEVVASLPSYLEENVDAQRGKGVFERSLTGLRSLNDLGYGHDEDGLVLSLVYNPLGADLPQAQSQLEQSYRKELAERYGIVFSRLFTLANMPIQRFGSTLISKGQFDGYLALLKSAHRAENLPQVMCRELISVDWRGFVYDCDFNQMLDLPLGAAASPVHLSDLDLASLEGARIRVADHCYGCTAGQGSSCSGALLG
ncbi:radical SAM/Cys-rich domain protein [Thiorhodococcus mannitoliphagus]|uniref:Radical SAM/Cys-rich domain protein n=1 Tax=Thiorhodococcus mannitoliphagus TaxID=329406 RepID=A0A6P1DQP4_9GAMM|nr:arsenosugar biosynthesis radical SAM (seleno)protein ArsS [Thiorhodococcus mannitoliphagus]NEX18996.1 radical SAM/Cys-rich domain protein [Thiorhodococcus mannitoliphagus]